ncbi:unnamed protein product [Fusarium graminearum]|nr:unnamed protein product [Fusarium graminearum]
MLSRRFPSRPGDEMIIWSLLCGDDTAENRLEHFWKGRLRVPIKSGFLMSTSDRVKGIRGLSWAPSSPFARPMELNVSSPDPAIYASYDGNGTIAVKLLDEKVSDCNTALHLRGDWCVYIVQPSDLEDLSAVPNSCWERAKQLLSSREYKRVIFVRPVFRRAHVVAGDEIPFIGPWNLNEGEGPPVAVCAAKDDRDTFDMYRLETELVHTNELWGEEWEWKGIYKEAPRNSIGGDKCDQYQVQLKIIYDCISRNFQYNIMSSPSSSSFTREQIWEEWKNCGIQPEERRDTTSSFVCHDIREIDIDGQWFKERDAPQKTGNDRPSSKPRVVLFPGQQTHDAANRAQSYFRRSLFRRTASIYSYRDLDDAFSMLVSTQILVPRSKMEEERIVDRAFDLLSRLPDTPIPLLNHPVLPGDQSKHGWLKIGGDSYVWEDLEVVHTTSAIVIRMALSIAATWDRSPKTNVRGKELHMFRKFLDFTSELIDSTTYESEKPSFKSPGQQWRWFVLKAYLWSTWQRCVAFHYWRILQDHLAIGFDYSDLSELALRPNLDSSLVSEKQTVLKSEYMCSLAYQILLRSRSTALLDLRQFHARFNDLFGSKPGRCNNRKSCDGESPARCRRMQGAMIVDQSQHDLLCLNPTNCNRILWNEESYRQVTGGRAVSIAACSDVSQVTLLYEGASPQTLTISHVWSHGQGGRPESGLNACLHARYSVIARKFGCSSYWIDAAYMHDLRMEAIMNINSVFSESRVVLLCDRDLMEIDVSVLEGAEHLSRKAICLRESILCTLLACDWNVRAWTLLEALRGRKNIHILCKSGDHNTEISLREVLQVVSTYGSINIGILFLMNYHLLPAPRSLDWLRTHTDGSSAVAMERIRRQQRRKVFKVSHDARLIALQIEKGFVTISEAATLLSQRHASRPGDDVIIWSLLVGDDPFKHALQLWRSGRAGIDILATHQTVFTGFLLSSVPRLRSPGPSWAPNQPGVSRSAIGEQTRYPPYDGNLSRVGTIEIEQEMYFSAVWGTSKIIFHQGSAVSYDIRPQDTVVNLHPTVSDSLIGYKEGMLLQPLQEDEAEPEETNGDAELEPKDKDETTGSGEVVLAALYKGPSKGPLFAICGRKHYGDEPWSWLGVIDWGRNDILPYFTAETVVLR